MNIKILLYKGMMLTTLIPSMLFSSNTNKEKQEYKFIITMEDLESIYSTKPTIDDLKKSLDDNSNITDEYKEYTKEFIELVEAKFPDFDFTIFNENLKQFNVIEISIEDMQKENPNRYAYYKISESSIYMHNEYKKEEIKKYCYFHELWHMFNNLCVKKDNIIYYRSTTMSNLSGTALDEGMTTFLTEQIYSKDILNYVNEYDEVKILYQIFGEDLLNAYTELGVDGIENLILKNMSYSEAGNLIYLMNNEKNDKNNSVKIYEILINYILILILLI